MSDDSQPRTGLWKNEPGKPAGYGGKIIITEPGEYWVNLYKNDRKETEKQPDLNLQLKLKQAPAQTSRPPPQPDFVDDDIPF